MKQLTIPLLLIAQLTFGQADNIKLFDFKSSTCDPEADSYRLRTRIIKKEFNGDILTVEIAATATCCVNFEPRTSVKDGVLYLDFEETGTECECSCCYEFIYQIKGIKDKQIEIKFRDKGIELSTEKYKTFPVTFKILNGDTIDYVDKYGLRQGRSYNLSNNLKEDKYYEFVDNVAMKYVTLYPNKNVQSVASREKIKVNINGEDLNIDSNFFKYIEYFETGLKKRECVNSNPNDSYKNGKCKEWNENGEVIYEGDFRK